jgi:hypothetical protein
MKKITTLLGLLIMSLFTLQAQEEAVSAGGAEMTFESEVIDYGTITQNADGMRTFKFKNTGNEPLIISNAKGSCGCTVPTWPKKPINPGESAEIKVKYATNRLGPINKSVTVSSNSASSPTKVLRIKGNVIEAKTTPVKESEGAAVPLAN